MCFMSVNLHLIWLNECGRFSFIYGSEILCWKSLFFYFRYLYGIWEEYYWVSWMSASAKWEGKGKKTMTSYIFGFRHNPLNDSSHPYKTVYQKMEECQWVAWMCACVAHPYIYISILERRYQPMFMHGDYRLLPIVYHKHWKWLFDGKTSETI
jgi:hypothetical protein